MYLGSMDTIKLTNKEWIYFSKDSSRRVSTKQTYWGPQLRLVCGRGQY